MSFGGQNFCENCKSAFPFDELIEDEEPFGVFYYCHQCYASQFKVWDLWDPSEDDED